VDQSDALRGLQALGDLDRDFERLAFRNALLLKHQIVETSLVHDFHRDVVNAVVFAEGENFHDMRMIDRCGDLRFVVELREKLRIAAELAAQQLDRDGPVQVHVGRFVNRAHAASAENFLQLILAKLPPYAHGQSARRTLHRRKGLLVGDVEHRAAA